MFIFLTKIYPQNGETGVLEALKTKISFAAQPWWEGLYIQNSLKIFSVDFTIHWWYLCEFLEKKGVKNL